MSSSTPNSSPSFPVPHPSPPAMQSTTANGPAGSSSLALPVPQPHATTSSGSTLRLPSPVLSSSSSHTGQPSHLSLHNSAVSSSSSLRSATVAEQRKEIREAWIDAEGEVPVLDKADDSWTPIRSGMLARKDSGGKNSWRDGCCVLLDSHLLFFEKETSSSGTTTKSSHVFRPIPLECLRLASFNDEQEVRKQHVGLLKRVGSRFRLSPTKESMYPFTVFHVAAKITRRHTLYTKSMTERNKWKAALESAIEARKSQQDTRMLYEPQVLNDGFFRIAPRIQFIRGIHYTGRVACAASFPFQGEDYIAIGCATGIYISKRAVEHSFRKVLEFNEPNSIVAVPEFNKFLVHCETTLSSYPLDKIIRVSQGDDASEQSLDDSEEKLAQGHGDVLFIKAGRLADRTLIVYASKSSKKVALHVFELTHQGHGPQTPANPGSSYQPLGSPVPIPEDPHDATIFLDKVAVYTFKAIYMIEPMNATNPCHKVVLDLPNTKHDANAFQRLVTRTKALLKLGKSDTPKVLELVGKASILGVTNENENNMLVVYNDLGCFMDQAGKAARSSYYIEWERKAEAFARRGPHLLLFSPGYIEVRDIDTGKLIRMVEVKDLRLLRSGSTEWPKLVAAMTSKQVDGSHTDRLVELVCNGN